jgi:hypothetical protein
MNVIVAFQGSIVATGVPQLLPNYPVRNGITICAQSTNAANMAVSDQPAVTLLTGYLLEKGIPAFIPLTGTGANTLQLYVIGTAGDKFSVVGS